MILNRNHAALVLALSVAVACGSSDSSRQSTGLGGDAAAGASNGSGGLSNGGGARGAGGKAAKAGSSSVDASTDAPVSTDAGDPCVVGEQNSSSTVGCNGPPPGPHNPGTPFGECLSSCPTGFACAKAGGSLGVCVPVCDAASTYVSKAQCPTGSRCFTFDPRTAFCLPDCRTGNDCSSGLCTTDGACGFPVGDGGSFPVDAGSGGATGTGGATGSGGGTASGGAVSSGGAMSSGGAVTSGGKVSGNVVLGKITQANVTRANVISGQVVRANVITANIQVQ